MSDVKVSEDAMFRAVELLAEANARAERAEAEAASLRSELADVNPVYAMVMLCGELGGKRADERAETYLRRVIDDGITSRADCDAKDARIAELEGNMQSQSIYCPLCGDHHATSQPCEVSMPVSDANDLDEVVRELGIEASDTTPAEAVRELRAENEALRKEMDEREAVFVGDGKTIADLRKRVGELETVLDYHQKQHRIAGERAEQAEYERDVALRQHEHILDRAEQAEAQLAEAKSALSAHKAMIDVISGENELLGKECDKRDAHIASLETRLTDQPITPEP